ncbi:MAG: hypothetical protein FWH12_07275 [Treponema sp.]|nr:hypothetical protein [Treponema sp.]
MNRDLLTLLCLALILLLVPAGLSALGRREEAPQTPVRTEWNLSITAIDTQGLSPSYEVMGDLVARRLMNSLNFINVRFRDDEESAFYQDYLWAQNRTQAAQALAQRRNERDLLLYRGDRPWRYRQNLRTVNQAIAELERELERIDALSPLIEGRPVFSFTDENLDGSFPSPPDPGREFLFCVNRNIDAFLTGTLMEYHDRIFLSLRLYTMHSRSYSWEDAILFSFEDLSRAMDEISARLAHAVSQTLPSYVYVQVQPSDALILIDDTFAALGETPIRIESPGTLNIDIMAENHVSVSYPLELRPGELTEAYFTLTPLGRSLFEADVPGSPGSRVFLGSLYAGDTPLSLELPRNEYVYISVETPEGEIGTMIYRDNSLVRGRANFTLTQDPPGGRALIETALPADPNARPVERARRNFYRSYGVLWFLLPAAVLTAGVASTYIAANNYSVAIGYYQDDPDMQARIYDDAIRARNIAYGAYGVMGLSFGITFFYIFRYLFVSGGEATPIVPVVSP